MTRPHSPMPGELPTLSQLNRATLIAFGAAAAILVTAVLLAACGARAAFRDLSRLPSARLVLSAFTLEDDALVRPSPLLEEIEDAGLAVTCLDADPGVRVFSHEALMDDPVVPAAARRIPSLAIATWLSTVQ